MKHRQHHNSAMKIFVCSFIFLVSFLSLLGSVYANDTQQADYIVLVVLEGIDSETIKSGSMPALARFAQEGAATWSAISVAPPLTVPAMASLLTGLPIKKHQVTPEWEDYDFARSFLRSPTVFDYMDLAGGKDSAVFFMDERLYQLSRPEIYVDAQMCGVAKPDCTPKTISGYIQDYLNKVTSEGGYGFRLIGVPNLLLVHLPTASRSGRQRGWNSDAYQQAVRAVDTAINDIVKTYQEVAGLDKTMFIVTGLNGLPLSNPSTNGSQEPAVQELGQSVPWISWGVNVKGKYNITRPVSILDTGATILYALGLETHTEWDSHAIEEIFNTKPKRRTTENEPSIAVH